MSSFEITGKLIKRRDTEQVTDSFKKREFVIESMDGEYSQFIKFELLQDKTSLIDGYSQNDEIKVSFNLRGREWNDKYFTNLVAWRIEAAATTQENPPQPIKVTPVSNESKKDDLPF